MKCAVLGVGVFGPGLGSWPAARTVLRGEADLTHGELVAPPAGMLPPAERRRAPASTRLALTAAQEALASSGIDPRTVPAVFASSCGSGEIIHDICAMLAAGDYQISPTKFHNSVHNAASGYYSIAAASHCAATSLCAYDGSAAAALLEAVVQIHDGSAAVLMVAYDAPYPFPLSAARPLRDAWAIGLLLGVGGSAAPLATLTLSIADLALAESTLDDPALEAARLHNPAARLLPLVAAIARRDSRAPQRVALRQQNGSTLNIDVS